MKYDKISGHAPAIPPRPHSHERIISKESGTWFTHDPAIYHDTDSGRYYIYSTGALCQRSSDLIHWEPIGKVVESPPEESVLWTKSDDKCRNLYMVQKTTIKNTGSHPRVVLYHFMFLPSALHPPHPQSDYS